MAICFWKSHLHKEPLRFFTYLITILSLKTYKLRKPYFKFDLYIKKNTEGSLIFFTRPTTACLRELSTGRVVDEVK